MSESKGKILVKDHDCHWYLIDVEKRKAFDAWLAAGPYLEGYDGEDFDEYRIDGPHSILITGYTENK